MGESRLTFARLTTVAPGLRDWFIVFHSRVLKIELI